VTVHDAVDAPGGRDPSATWPSAPFKTPRTTARWGSVFRNARVEPNFAGYRRSPSSCRRRGLAVALRPGRGLADAERHFCANLMPLETFFFRRWPTALEQLAELADAVAATTSG